MKKKQLRAALIKHKNRIESLAADETFVAIYLRYRKHCAIDVGQIAIVAIVLCLAIFLPSHTITTTIRSTDELVFGFAASLLGLILAGYTILVSLADSTLLTALTVTDMPARHGQKTDGSQSALRSSLDIFVGVFIEYLLLMLVALMFVVLTADGIAFGAFVRANTNESVFNVVLRIAYGLSAGLFFWCLYSLKDFVYNVVYFSEATIRWKLHQVLLDEDE